MSNANFKDLFSRQSKIYSVARPSYPRELFDFIVEYGNERLKAWDCATGNGQCAISLAHYFDHVIATDASENQIKHASPNPKVIYHTATAESSGISDNSIDLVTVATALHWFNIPEFFEECKRVLRPNGLVAVWAYTDTKINDDIDPLVEKLGGEILKDYWAPEVKIIRDKYQTIDFPFREIKTPVFESQLKWSLHDLKAYFESWSAFQKYLEIKKENPLDLMKKEIEEAWGDPMHRKTITWPIYMRLGMAN